MVFHAKKNKTSDIFSEPNISSHELKPLSYRSCVNKRIVYFFFNCVTQDPTASSITLFWSEPDKQDPLSNINTKAKSNGQLLCVSEWAVVI